MAVKPEPGIAPDFRLAGRCHGVHSLGGRPQARSPQTVDLAAVISQLLGFSPGNIMAVRGPRKSSAKDQPPRAWQRMLSGRRLDLLDPSPLDIEVEDIAHGLARVARWNGQTIGEHGFSVAQHSLVVEDIAAHLSPGLAPKWRLCALLHDAPEYVIGDMISPFKAALGYDYRLFEDRLEAAIHLRFGLPAKTPPEIKALIKQADHASAYFEAVQLAGFTVDEALHLFGSAPDNYTLHLEPLSPSMAGQRYLQRFVTLAEAMGIGAPSIAFSSE
jgi:5'-deoxynucleotidase YfbR-like HD superfamily hydrolase